jgi:6-phosphogluconolactonase
VTDDVRIQENAADVADVAAAAIASWIAQAHADGRTVHVALAGGTTPAATYERLARIPVAWAAVHLWFGDERMVPPDAADANAELARINLIEPAGIAPSNVHRVPTDGSVDDAARAYADEIMRVLPVNAAGTPRFDLVMLGLGEDGHVASLFPNAPTLVATGVCLPIRQSPKPPPERVSLSLPVINAATRRLLLTTGPGKSDALARALGPPNPATPASMLRTAGTTVVCDIAAAARLHRP